ERAHVRARAGPEVVDAQNVMPRLEQARADVRADQPSAAGDERPARVAHVAVAGHRNSTRCRTDATPLQNTEASGIVADVSAISRTWRGECVVPRRRRNVRYSVTSSHGASAASATRGRPPIAALAATMADAAA